MNKDLNIAMQSVSINSATAAATANGDCCSAATAAVPSFPNGCHKVPLAAAVTTTTPTTTTEANRAAPSSTDAARKAQPTETNGSGSGSSGGASKDETDNIRFRRSSSTASTSAVVTSSSYLCKPPPRQTSVTKSLPPPFLTATVGEKRTMLHQLCQQLLLTDEQIEELNYRILQEVRKGLSKETHFRANVKCFVTYVQDLPNGNERGKFLALDLGGTNFRVLLIHLKEDHDFQMESRIYAIPQHIMLGSGVQLFDHIAECLAKFMSEHNVYQERLPLGFTFSFPLTQLGLTKGLLVTWTKGFNCAGVVDQDVVQLLKDAIARRGDVQIDVCAILNDTTGTLMSCAWKNPHCKIGLIVGTGSNACYVERVEEAELFDGAANGKPHVLINTEWGAFGDNGALDFVRTEFDDDVDKHSINPGKQKFEKMISGMYMGELVRLVIVKFINAGILFKGLVPDVLMMRGQFFTKYVSEIEADEPGTFNNCRLVLEELGLGEATDDDCANVRYICECVSKRAAHLVSCGIATLINKMDEPHVTVGVDGSVYRFHPKFHDLMVEKISELVKPGITFDLMLSEDGSGRGAALVAAVACREDNPKK